MKSLHKVSRREFLKTAILSLSALPFIGLNVSADDSNTEDVFSGYFGKANYERIREYLQESPLFTQAITQEQIPELDEILQAVENEDLDALWQSNVRDFADGNVIDVAGWQFSHTEVVLLNLLSELAIRDEDE